MIMHWSSFSQMVSQKHCSEPKMALEEKMKDGALEMLLDSIRDPIPVPIRLMHVFVWLLFFKRVLKINLKILKILF